MGKISMIRVAGQHLFTAAKYLGGYATVISGAAIASEIVGEVANRKAPAQEPLVSGASDTFMGLVDPLDLSGYRKKKEDKLKEKIAKGEASAKEQKEAKKKALEKLRAAKEKAAKAEKLAAQNAEKAAKLEAAGKAKEAENARKLERAQERLAQLTEKLVDKAAQTSDPGKQLAVAQKAEVVSQQAQNPMTSTVQAMASAVSDAGKSVAADIYDSIHRAEEPDYEQLASRIMEGDASAFLELPLDSDFSSVEGAVAGIDFKKPGEECRFCHVAISGSCCAACAMKPVGCGCTAGDDDDDEVSGDDDDDEVSGDDDDDEVSGDDDFYDVSGDDDDEVSGDDDDDEVSGDDDDEVSGGEFFEVAGFFDDDDDEIDEFDMYELAEEDGPPFAFLEAFPL